MPTPDPEQPQWLDQPANVKRLWRGFLVVLALTVAAQLLVQMHPHFDIEAVFGFNAWFGFCACAGMIGVAKLLALVLKRPDTYYDEPGRVDHDH